MNATTEPVTTSADYAAKCAAEQAHKDGNAIGATGGGYPGSYYPYTKADMAAATRLQIWREIMQTGRDQSGAPVDAEKAADAAARIFDKLHGVERAPI